MDDIVICSNDHREHRRILKQVLDRFRKYNLKCRLSKIQLGTPEINYLGYNLSHAHGIRPGQAKIQAVSNWSPPSTVKEIKQFLGLCSFFRRTVPNFSSIANPLNKLTRKNSNWSKGDLPTEALEAFKLLKERLCSRPCLTPVDFEKEFIVTVDASTTGLGAILSQVDGKGIERPNAYASRSLKDEETRYAPFHLEHLAMVWACTHFKPYLSGKHFRLRTDHRPLTALNKVQGQTVERLQMLMEAFQPFTVEYLPGDKMPADGLSRQVQEVSVRNDININWNQLWHLQKQDKYIKALACTIMIGNKPEKDELKRFVESYIDKVVIVDKVICLNEEHNPALAPKALQGVLLKLAHDSPAAGHHSYEKTLHRLSRFWYWPEIKEDCKYYCKACIICNKVNLPAHKKQVELQQIPPPMKFNDRVHIDLMGPLPLDQGNRYLLVMIDAFSKFMHVRALSDKTMQVVSEGFMEDWIAMHGVCNTLVSDQGKEFNNSCLLYTSPSPRDQRGSRMPSSA